MMHLISYGSSEAYIEEDHAGKRHTITAILPREEVEELYRRLVGDEWREIETAPKDGTQFLAALSNGWVRIIWAFPDDFKGRYRWWHCHDTGMSQPPIVETHHPNTDWAKNNTILATRWQPLPLSPISRRAGHGNTSSDE